MEHGCDVDRSVAVGDTSPSHIHTSIRTHARTHARMHRYTRARIQVGKQVPAHAGRRLAPAPPSFVEPAMRDPVAGPGLYMP